MFEIILGDWEIPYIYYGIFDGHAGSGCAVTAANELHQVKMFLKPVWEGKMHGLDAATHSELPRIPQTDIRARKHQYKNNNKNRRELTLGPVCSAE